MSGIVKDKIINTRVLIVIFTQSPADQKLAIKTKKQETNESRTSQWKYKMANTTITAHVSNYEKYGDPSQTMKALTWQGNRTVKVGQ
jgi:hypothetical protein